MSFPHIHDHYSPYSNPDSPSPDEDENASLRSQALNADGTPKRPMNAFMIFARRRRPQVSAANQMMRTGEISKILSKEWNTMPMSDKQFYLDQAKKLKENFNAKYPDYVYRRRPNNSRKKRRTDPIRGVDAYGVPRDDSLSPHDSPEYHQLSPVDALLSADGVPSLATPSYRMHYPHSAHYYPDATAAAAAAAAAAAVGATPAPAYSYYPTASAHPHAHNTRPASYDGLSASVSFPPTHSPSIYHPDDDLLGTGAAAAAAAAAAASAAASFPRLDPVKPEGWGTSVVGSASSGGGAGAATSALSARRGMLQPPQLRNSTTTSSSSGGGSAHARHWSDGSSPSAPGFPTFQTLTAPFYPSSGTVSPSTASSSSVASYFGAGAGGAERDFEQPRSTSQSQPHSQQHSPQTHPSQQQQHSPAARSHGHSPSFGGAQPPPQPPPLRQFSGPTLSSTLALSPAGLWSSVRSSSASVTPKSEL